MNCREEAHSIHHPALGAASNSPSLWSEEYGLGVGPVCSLAKLGNLGGRWLVSSRGFADLGKRGGKCWYLLWALSFISPGSQERRDYQVEALHLESSKHFPCELI